MLKKQGSPTLDHQLKIKEREMQNQETQLSIVKRELQSLKVKYDSDMNVDNVITLENKLKDAERRNVELMKEIKGLEKIQVEQGKALEKLTTNNEHALKLKSLIDELR